MLLMLGLVVLACIWLGPLPALARHAFSAHMAMHIAVVAIAAPLMAAGLAGTRFDPVRHWPHVFSAVPASMIELVVVWGWHVPALHMAARTATIGLVVEQFTFLASGLLLWLSVLGGAANQNWRAGAGVVALLFTSIHMTLLGALFAIAPRPLYGHGAPFDQHLGGTIMILMGGASYMAGGLWLMASMLNRQPSKEHL